MAADYQVDIIRHGFSCGNMHHLLHLSGEGPQDPYLSDFGILQVIDLRRRLLERGGDGSSHLYDRILTSYLRRAIETALLLFAPRDLLIERYPELVDVDFGDWSSAPPTITVIPYISEIGADFAENHGVGMEQLRQEFMAFDRLLDFRILMRLDPDCSTEYDYPNFLKVLYSFPRHSRIALISHGNVMRALLAIIHRDNYSVRVPRNTELWPLAVLNQEMEMVGEPLRPARAFPFAAGAEKSDRRCRFVRRQTAGKRHGTPQNSKRTRRPNKKSTRSHNRKTIRR